MDELLSIRKSFQDEIEAAEDLTGLQQIKIKYTGKKGLLSAKMKSLSSIPPDKRPAFGSAINEVKNFIEDILTQREVLLKGKDKEKRLQSERLDISLPGKFIPFGNGHPIVQILEEIKDIFSSMGFDIEEGPEIELDHYNFEALNIPKDHPARDMQDTFYISDDVVLRTHTSPVQIRVMEKRKPPLQIIAPGKVYRCDADLSHTPMFHQVEGLMVDKDISFSDLKGVLELFIHSLFGKDTPVRFRPSYFPFTEPSAEVDIGCIFCSGKGCRVCKTTGWLEILGSGLVNPKVFEMAGYDPGEYSGFAFGMGVERITMLKYSIDDIRLFYENDLRFLRQF
ncbi:MAG: phenylalanine--tRNA ligase subunit alpha [Nitrospirae bacterium GWC2_42_7]|nr:MAG: phenylalanine--tRNA ligase subunit alpha [Nitrospirae bacterium GWC2_42_7]